MLSGVADCGAAHWTSWTGASGGTFKGATAPDFTEDIRSGLAYLRTRPGFGLDRLACSSHQRGLIIAPMVADKDPLARIGCFAASRNRGRKHYTLQFSSQKPIETQHSAHGQIAMRDSQVAESPGVDALMALDPWMKFFLTYDPVATERKVEYNRCNPHRSRDQQAWPEQVPLMEAAFKEGLNKELTARVVADVNHLFVRTPMAFPRATMRNSRRR